MPEPLEPSVSDQEFMVTSYVIDRFAGDSYSSYVSGGARYYTFGDALNERWVDTDQDGFWDYGLRDEGYGHWSTFDGEFWRDSNGEIVGASRAATTEPIHCPAEEEMMAAPPAPADDGWFL